MQSHKCLLATQVALWVMKALGFTKEEKICGLETLISLSDLCVRIVNLERLTAFKNLLYTEYNVLNTQYTIQRSH